MLQSSPKKQPPKPFQQQSRGQVSSVAIPPVLMQCRSSATFWELHQLRKFEPTSEVLESLGALHFDRHSPAESFNAICQPIPLDESEEETRITFYDFANKVPSDHPTDTLCRPDLVAVRAKYATGLVDPASGALQSIHWSALECVVEQISSGDNNTKAVLHAGAYLYYLLAARPDLVVAQGFLVLKEGLVFFFGVGGSELSFHFKKYNDPGFNSLLYAFLYRLHVQDGDLIEPTIKRQYKDKQWTFDLRMSATSGGHDFSSGFRLGISSRLFTGRTHIFFLPLKSSPSTFSDTDAYVVKDHYRRLGSRFLEEDVLAKVHLDGRSRVPGIVYGTSFSSEEIALLEGQRVRFRMGMDAMGNTFLRVGTILEGLCLLYDLLEVTRFIYREGTVLHRDIHESNVLFTTKEVYYNPSDEEKKRFASLRYIANLLDPGQSQWKTKLLLIDFGNAEIEAEASKSISEGFKCSASPLCIARAVAEGGPIPVSSWSPSVNLPVLPPPPSPWYKEAHADRLERFPSNARSTVFRNNTPKDSGEPIIWKHELRHDAESVVWLLIYWLTVVQLASDGKEKSQGGGAKAPPEDSDSDSEFGCLDVDDPDSQDDGLDLEIPSPLDDFIPLAHWSSLTSVVSSERMAFFQKLDTIAQKSRPGNRPIHEDLSPLAVLIQQISAHFIVDHHWIDGSKNRSQEAMKEADYMHEVLQRILLTFILKHSSDRFMVSPLSKTHRRIEDGANAEIDYGAAGGPKTAMKNKRTHAYFRSTQASKQTPASLVEGLSSGAEGDDDQIESSDDERRPPAPKRARTLGYS